jgi:hypothetical protein
MNDFNLRVEIREFTTGKKQRRYGWLISIQEPGSREYLSKYDDCTSSPIDAWKSALEFIERLKAADKFLPGAGIHVTGKEPDAVASPQDGPLVGNGRYTSIGRGIG